MINVNEATKSAYKGDSVHKIVTVSIPNRNITITNTDLKNQSVELTETIETEDNLTFKGCNASQFKFTVRDIVTDIRGEYIEASIQISETDSIPLFKGYVKAQNNETYEDVATEFVCYDVLNNVSQRNMQSWIDSLTFPITIKNFRDSLFSALSISQETVTLVNDSLSITANLKNYVENPTASDLMRWICEINGRPGQISREDGKFHYRKFTTITKGTYPSGHTFPSDHTFPSGENASSIVDTSLYSKVEYQPYEVEGIDKVTVFDNEGIEEGVYGSGSNVFSIIDNPIAFCVTNMDTLAQNLYTEIRGKPFIPLINLECVGQPWLECGDSIMTNTRKNIVRSYILNRTLRGIQALTDTFTSDNQKVRTPAAASPATMINANRKKVLDIQADLVVMNELIAQKATIAQLEATNATVGTLSAREANFETATAQNFTAVNGRVDTLSVSKLDVQTATATYAKITSLDAVSARVGTLEADHVTTAQLTAVQGDIQTLSTNKLDASTASVTYATISSLDATNLTVSGKLNASDAALTYATITNLDAVSGRVGDLEADHVTTQQLQAVQGSINSLSAIAITTQNLSAQTINASQITGLTIAASQITSGTIAADRLSADTIRTKFIDACAVSPLQGRIDIGTIRTGSVQIYDNGYHTLKLNTRTIGGTSVKLVEWS